MIANAQLLPVEEIDDPRSNSQTPLAQDFITLMGKSVSFMQNQAVWIIDSDGDDQYMVQEVWRELGLDNELFFLQSAEEVMRQLARVDTAPFIILCEVSLPGVSGFELREKMLAAGSQKFRSVPFIFWSTTASEEQIVHAYNLSVHGFFLKDSSLEELKSTFVNIVSYWMKSKMPSKLDQAG